MAGYRLTPAADADFDGIYEYSLLTFGEAVADAYALDLVDAFVKLTENPLLGKSYDHIKPGSRGLIRRSHIVYYIAASDSVIVLRILHQSQDPLRHL